MKLSQVWSRMIVTFLVLIAPSAFAVSASTPESLSWWSAWGKWWSGSSVAGEHLYGWPVLYWGRLGKLIQFFAAWLVVVELVPTEALRRWMPPLDKVFRAAWKDLLRTPQIFLFAALHAVPLGTRKSGRLRASVLARRLFPAAVVSGGPRLVRSSLKLAVLGGVMGLWGCYLLVTHRTVPIEWTPRIWWHFAGLVVEYMLAGLLLLPALALAASLAGAAMLTLISPIIWLGRREDHLRGFKLLGLGLLMIGFSLDLLAS